jgi:protocatechuate 3,4-dioxygenase alpha subunit
MPQRLDYLSESASQTAGPFVHLGLMPRAAGVAGAPPDLGTEIAGPQAAGQRIRVEGQVLDGTGSPLRDAVLEVWQANAAGVYAHPEGGGTVEDGFRGWGRVATDPDSGTWSFDTIKPGATPGREGTRQAPHISFWIVARGINTGLNTRMYFSDEAAANTQDPVLRLIEWESRRATLIAAREGSDAAPLYRFDIRLQGPEETVFFDI